MNRWLVVMAVMVVLAGGWFTNGQGQDIPKDRNAFMQLKLKNAQMILNGLAVRDFQQIESGAQTLFMLSKKAEFQMANVPNYERYSSEFSRTAEELARQAKDKNLDAAALSYVQLTLQCVECHKHIRGTKVTLLEQ